MYDLGNVGTSVWQKRTKKKIISLDLLPQVKFLKKKNFKKPSLWAWQACNAIFVKFSVNIGKTAEMRVVSTFLIQHFKAYNMSQNVDLWFDIKILKHTQSSCSLVIISVFLVLGSSCNLWFPSREECIWVVYICMCLFGDLANLLPHKLPSAHILSGFWSNNFIL